MIINEVNETYSEEQHVFRSNSIQQLEEEYVRQSKTNRRIRLLRLDMETDEQQKQQLEEEYARQSKTNRRIRLLRLGMETDEQPASVLEMIRNEGVEEDDDSTAGSFILEEITDEASERELDEEGSTAGSRQEIDEYIITAIAHLESLRVYQLQSSVAMEDIVVALAADPLYSDELARLNLCLESSRFLSFQVLSISTNTIVFGYRFTR
jgi:hypothetical protein